MSQDPASGRLVALVADRDIEESLAKLFARPERLDIRSFRFEIRRHPGRDAGCRADAANFLRQFLRSCRNALVVFDRHGCGSDAPREQIEAGVESKLYGNGWGSRGRVVVIDPEIEEWVWSGSTVVSKALGWGQRYGELRTWLVQRGLWDEGLPKPNDPKAAMIQALRGASRATRRRRSARIFGEIAAGAPFEGCGDPAFRKLQDTLREWFPQAGRSATGPDSSGPAAI